MTELVHALLERHDLPDSDLIRLMGTDVYDAELFENADRIRRSVYGDAVYLRGLIEFTNYCKNDCYYCGIRRSNLRAARYRLTPEEIMECCRTGYALGYRTFVLQGGEDGWFSDDRMCSLISGIHTVYPDCAITLSIGEKSRESYQRYFDAGAKRYLLRHETADAAHYRQLHPEGMSGEHRKRCLYELKEIGYQIGSGFMVGSPFQTAEHLVADLRYLQELQPDMIGIGPYIRHSETPFSDYPNGTLELTLRMIAILRLMFPYALIPATTALGSISPVGRELGLKAGANVIMPNLSPQPVRAKYDLYENKICTGEQAEQCRGCLEQRVTHAGYRIVSAVGDPVRASE